MAQGAICRGHECNHTLLRFKSPTWFSVYFSGLFPLAWAFPWLQSERREKSERGYGCDWSTLQTKHQFTRRGDSCVCASGPLWLANEILLLDAELLLNSKASKKRGEWPPLFFWGKETAEDVYFNWSMLAPSSLSKNWNVTIDKKEVLVEKVGEGRQGSSAFS